MKNGTFTISNHGVSGSLFAAPIIINQPQVAILGIGKLDKRVVVEEVNGVDTMVIKPMCYVSLSMDHRALDAHQTNTFLRVFVDSEGAIFHEDALELFDDVNIGVGTALGDEGLVVPVVQLVQEMNLFEIAHALTGQTEKARSPVTSTTPLRSTWLSLPARRPHHRAGNR